MKATKQINQLKKPTDGNKILKQNQKYIPNRIACLAFLKNLVSKGSIKPASRPLWWYLCPFWGKNPKNSRFPKISKTPHFFSKLLFEYLMWFFRFLAASIFFFSLILNSGKRNIFLTVKVTGQSSFLVAWIVSPLLRKQWSCVRATFFSEWNFCFFPMWLPFPWWHWYSW